MSQARVLFISNERLRREQVLALPKPRALTLGVPLYALVAMVFIGLTGVCVTVTLRTHAELRTATETCRRLQEQVAVQAAENHQLRQALRRLEVDPRAIERPAREMGLVKPHDMVLVWTGEGEAAPPATPHP
ncbi:MAG: septum formation initiator family protein [Chloracidobacterium sp.]|nr:septum formation initiator family protein [Chloracidobacterium sp.]MDW8218695.1 septum formation initiator family protein [Acidobacteriota bacterium]